MRLLRQRIYQIVAGYEDANDADRLRHDPMLQIVADQKLGEALGSQPTLSRWENAPSARDSRAMDKVPTDSKRQKMARIAREIAQCGHCRFDSIGKPVPGDGSPDARLVFVGEAPGRNEAAVGHAFVGRSGKLLRQSIRFLGPKRKIVFTNVLKYLPKSGAPNSAAIQHVRIHLLQQLQALRPSLVVLLGTTAARAVFGHEIPVLKKHGSFCRKVDDPTRYCITVHPSAAMRFPAMRRVFLGDLELLAKGLHRHTVRTAAKLPAGNRVHGAKNSGGSS